MFLKRGIELFCLFCFVSCSNGPDTLPYYNTPDFTPIWNAGDPESIHRIAAFEFIDQNKGIITNESIDGKIAIVNFFFTTCTSICPNMMENLKKVNNTFRKDDQIVILSHTVMPWVDSVPQLMNYAARNGINNPQWHLLTGDKSQIYTLARKSYFAEEELGFAKDSTEFLHTEYVLLLDKKEHIRGIYKGTLSLEMLRLIEDVRLLKKEK
jgi:protein SCO1/2